MSNHHLSFWEFSLSLYRHDRVKSTCLSLQDSHSADVNLLLFLLYQAYQQRQLDALMISQLDTAVKAWRNTVIQPLREARNALKGTPFQLPNHAQETLRQQVLALELSAEKLEQEYLETLPLRTQFANAHHAARINLEHYASLLTEHADGTWQDLLHTYQTLMPDTTQ